MNLLALRRALSSRSPASSSSLAMRMEQERKVLFQKPSPMSIPALPPSPPATSTAARPAKTFKRRMPDHVLPEYIEANFRMMAFVLTRAPKLSDFPREKMYRPESIDLLFRHYYKNSRS